MDVAYAPAVAGSTSVLSIELDEGAGRLWFAVGENDDGVEPASRVDSTAGFLNTTTWQDGVVYTGLDQLRSSESHAIDSLSFTGIARDAPTGRIGLASRSDAIVLVPR